MELETAVRRLLLGNQAVAGYVGQKVFKFTLMEPVDQTGGRAVVLSRSGGWAQPDTVKSLEYPLLQVECYADCDRDDNGNVLTRNAVDKAYALYRTIDPLLHAKRDAWWGAGGSDDGMKMISCVRWSEPISVESKDQHTGDPVLGDSAYVWARYALIVVH